MVFFKYGKRFFLWTVSRKLKSCRPTMDHCSLRPWRQILRVVGGDPDLIKDWMSEGIQNGSHAAGLFVCQQTSIWVWTQLHQRGFQPPDGFGSLYGRPALLDNEILTVLYKTVYIYLFHDKKTKKNISYLINSNMIRSQSWRGDVLWLLIISLVINKW